ncbi:MAG: hypothetical protein NT171_13610, partial [Planctomycetota bacterium]|nr:hypothetical protein [Planctomycetota bacterium]
TGTVNGITLTGTVTSTGSLTLGGTLSGVSLATQVTGTLPIANGGTGTTTAQLAINALAGAVTSGSYLRGNGTNVVMATIQAADVPTLNQNTTGTASGSVSGTASYVPKFTSANVIGNSQIYDNGTNIGIGTASPSYRLQVSGQTYLGNGASNPLYIDQTVADGVVRDSVYLYEASAQGTGRQAISWYNGNQGYYKARIYTEPGPSYAATRFYIDTADNARTVATRLCIHDGNVGINTTSPGAKLQVDTGAAATKGLIVKGFTSQNANLQEWQNSSGTALAYMDASGNFAAVTKSFLIDHPSLKKKALGKKLRYSSLEGPENAVYFRGTLTGNSCIVLPDYWIDLVDSESVTVVLTPRKYPQPNLFIGSTDNVRVMVESDREICCDFMICGTRKDVQALEVEPDGN